MILSIWKHKTPLVTLKIERGATSIEDAADNSFQQEIERLISEGVTADRDVYDVSTKTHIMINEHVRPDHPHFALALKQYLQRAGYDVTEKHPEVEEEIKHRLGEFPEDGAKTDLLKRLPEMSYLEQTYVLEQLKTFSESEGK